ncbi:uncharacterized protein LOC131622860 [Vicia villosa]|uniref:uncharacterized protein LOC131622860 n=1 Tax=Vicia villosa TaxID=3911 RepID=UPI00273C48C1|nr:uncharacterized protein LOC131622860 [Vicia villosa]
MQYSGKRGRSDKLVFGCDRGGKYKKTDSETQSASKRCGCPFKIRSTPSKDGSGWKIDVKCGVHNHGLPDRFEGHAFVSRLNTDDKQHIVDLTKRHVPPRHILLSLQERDPENVTRITQIYKHKSKIQKDIRGPRTEMQQLLKLVEESGYVYWSRKKDESEVVRDIFWAHPESVKLLNMFPIVLIMLENSLGDLCKCWEAMNDNIKIQVGNIRASFHKSFYEVEHAHTSPFYSNLRGSVSKAALRQIAEEWLRIDMVGTDTQKCGCTHRKVYGLPCACELGRYTLSGDAIPIEAIHIHWRKLSMEGNQDIDADDGSEIDMTNAIDEIWKMWRSLDVVEKRALKSRVCEIAYPTTTKMCPPPEKIKTKGGVKKKGKRPVGYDVYRDPSGYEYVDQAHLNYIRPFIDDIVDVRDDGNCGFRAIASLHGYGTDGWSMVRRDLEKEIIGPRSKLYEDLFGERLPTVRSSLVIETLGQQPPNKWMTLPELGYLIANRYNVVLVSLGHPSLSYFPMTSAHSPNASIYCIGFVNGNHWVQVNMNEGFPFSPVTNEWKKYRTKDATSWMEGFAGRLQHWQRLMPILPKYVSLD